MLSLNLLSKLFVDLDTSLAQDLRTQLFTANRRFDAVCERAVKRHDDLHGALLESGDLWKVIQDLYVWLEETEVQVRSNEPVDVTNEEALKDKYPRLRVNIYCT